MEEEERKEELGKILLLQPPGIDQETVGQVEEFEGTQTEVEVEIPLEKEKVQGKEKITGMAPPEPA